MSSMIENYDKTAYTQLQEKYVVKRKSEESDKEKKSIDGLFSSLMGLYK